MPENRDPSHLRRVPQRVEEGFPDTPPTSVSSCDNEIWMLVLSDSSEDDLPLFPMEDEARPVPSAPPM